MEFKPLPGRQFPRFSGIKTFFRLPVAPIDENFDVALVGIPYDGSVSYRPGARFAPARVREASSLGRGFHWSRAINFFNTVNVADVGDCPVVPIDQNQTYQQVEEFFGQIVAGDRKFVAVGGDHSLTLATLRAVHRHYKMPLNFIHFDAHLDTYPAAWGCEYHHGSFLRHAVEEGLIKADGALQIGIRGPLAGGDDLNFVKNHKFHTTTVDDIRINGLEAFIKNLPVFDSNPTYISFDIDCLDPAYAPGTGTPVPGGLTTYETQRILRALKVPNLVAADVMEVSPPYDQSEITCLAAVDTMFELLCMMAENRK